MLGNQLPQDQMLENVVNLDTYKVDFCFYSALSSVRTSFTRRSIIYFL